jgi:hypothetical protein
MRASVRRGAPPDRAGTRLRRSSGGLIGPHVVDVVPYVVSGVLPSFSMTSISPHAGQLGPTANQRP